MQMQMQCMQMQKLVKVSTDADDDADDADDEPEMQQCMMLCMKKCCVDVCADAVGAYYAMSANADAGAVQCDAC